MDREKLAPAPPQFPSQSKQDADRKLQSLAFVHRHNADNIFLLPHDIDLPHLLLLLPDPVNILYESVQAVVYRGIEFPCLFHQKIHIRRSLGPIPHHLDGLIDSRLIVDILDQLRHCGVRRLSPQPIQYLEKTPCLVLQQLPLPGRRCLLLIHQQGGIQIGPAAASPEHGELFLRETVHWTAHHSRQGQIQSRIIYDLKHLCHQLDFPCVKKPLAVLHHYRDPALGQHIKICLSHRPDTPGEYNDIFVFHPAQRLPILYIQRFFPLCHSLDPGCRKSCLQFCVPFIQYYIGIDPVRHRFPGIGEAPARLQTCFRVIFHAADIPVHHPAENRVSPLQHHLPAPKILVQVNAAVSGSRRHLIGLQFFCKQLRTGIPETVDALLHIPHHKEIRFSPRQAVPGYAGEKGVLDMIAVLVLVDHNLREML